MSQDQHTQDFAGNLSSSEIPDINNIIRPYSDADVIKPKGDQETIVTFGCQWGTGERLHLFLDEEVEIGLLPHVQAMLLARHISIGIYTSWLKTYPNLPKYRLAILASLCSSSGV